MLNLKSTATFDSTLYPGVAYTLKVMNLGERLSQAADELPLERALASATSNGELTAEALPVVAEMRKRKLAKAIVSVSGVLIDDKPATVDELLKCAPDDLLVEMADRFDEVSGMRGGQEKNSQLPITSSEVVGTGASATTV